MWKSWDQCGYMWFMPAIHSPGRREKRSRVRGHANLDWIPRLRLADVWQQELGLGLNGRNRSRAGQAVRNQESVVPTTLKRPISTTPSSVKMLQLAVFILGSKLPIWPSFLRLGLLWSTNLTPQRIRLFPPPFLCKSETSMCRQLREMGGGVDDVHRCATHSRGVLKPGNSWWQQSVHHFIRGRQDEQLDSQEMLASPRSL